MAVIALASAKGSPGVTTTALALTLVWPGRCVLAECDPAGGSVLPGYLRGALPADRGLRELAVAELRGELREQWWGQLVDLDAPRRERLLLPGLTDPVQSGTLQPLWSRFAEFFASMERVDPGYDMIVDCGRLAVANPPWPLLCSADATLLVVRGDLPSVAAAVPALRVLRERLTEHGNGTGALGLLVAGGGTDSGRDVAHHLRVRLVDELPHDPRTARVLSHGGDLRRDATLLRAATSTHARVRTHIDRHRQQVRPPDDPAATVRTLPGQRAT